MTTEKEMQETARRRTFRARLSVRPRISPFASTVSGPPVEAERRMVLEDYLTVTLNRRNTSYPLIKLQLQNFLFDLLELQNRSATFRKMLEQRKKAAGAGLEAKTNLAAEIKSIEQELYLCRTEERAIRDIGDGIAWRQFDYDRAILYEIANRHANPYVEKGGLKGELYELLIPI